MCPELGNATRVCLWAHARWPGCALLFFSGHDTLMVRAACAVMRSRARYDREHAYGHWRWLFQIDERRLM